MAIKDVSFVVVCYNHARYADRVAHFLKHQNDVEDAEFIFIDDGSPDDTVVAFRRATEGWQNTLVHRQDNKGPSNALNQGLRQATRKYVKLVGGDDLLHPDATRLLHSNIKANNAVFAMGRLKAFDFRTGLEDTAYWENLMAEPGEGSATRINDPLMFLLKSMDFNPSCVLLDREVAMTAGGSDETIFVEDYSLCLRMALYGAFVSIAADVAYGPGDDGARLSFDGAQTLHDMNAALANLLRDQAVFSRSLKNRITRSALGRGCKWARRHENAHVVSRINLLYLLANLRIGSWPLISTSETMMKAACEPFGRSRDIRRPIPEANTRGTRA